MAYRSVLIESDVHLSVRNRQLVIRADGDHSLPVEDLSALVLESRQSTITTAALSLLGQSGCAVYVCDEKHMPCGVLQPFAAHSRELAVVRRQLEAPEPLKKRLWQAIVVAKIRNQAACLSLCGKQAAADGLLAMAGAVRSGDTANTEAAAAARYFPALFEPGFTRGRDDPRNAALNYGYAILRGSIARHLAAYGFAPYMGLHHRSELNNFNLADDLIEPFRPLVDCMTASWFGDEPFTAENRRLMLTCLHMELLSGGSRHSAGYAIERLVQSLSKSLEQKEVALQLPALEQLRLHAYE